MAVVLALVAATAPSAKTPPTPCQPGRYLVDPAKAPLVPGGTSVLEAIELDANGQLSIASGCAATAAKIRAGRKADKVMASWASCGTLARVRFVGVIKAPACSALTGTLKAAKTKPKKFGATRSTCGDGVVDPATEECESGGAACAGGGACQQCACTLPPCGSATRPQCAGTCDPGLTCRDVFLVGCACFL